MFKIILIVFAILIIVVVALGAIVFLDLAAYAATGKQTLTPTGTSIGKALVIYDPGLSGTAKNVADKVASDLQTRGYIVTLAGVKSSAASSVDGYEIIVIGGPVYAGALTSSIKDALGKMAISQGNGVKVGVFGSGQGATSADDITQIKQSIPASSADSILEAVIVKIGSGEDLNSRVQDFVNQLLS